MPSGTATWASGEISAWIGLRRAAPASWAWIEAGSAASKNRGLASFCRPAKQNVNPRKARSGRSARPSTSGAADDGAGLDVTRYPPDGPPAVAAAPVLLTRAGRRRQPVAHATEQEKSEHDADYQAGGDQPLPGPGPADLAPGPAQPVPRGQPEHLAQVAEHVNGHGGEPQ